MNKPDTSKHNGHEVTVKRAKPNSPHWGYEYCSTCECFIGWVNKDRYLDAKRQQLNSGQMWFGQYQGLPLSEVPSDYLSWAIENTKLVDSQIGLLQRELARRGD